jgi:isopenicillin N synthase-like dioxygenase
VGLIPVVDLTAPDVAAEQLDAVKQATETVGVIQVVNHGIPVRFIGEFGRRIGRPSREQYVGRHAHAPVWRGDDPELRDLTFRYIAAGQSLVGRVLDLYARAQGLPAGTFPVSPLSYLSFTVNNYPVWTYPDTGNDEDKLLLLERADGAAVTVLAQGCDQEELQVRLPAGEWLPVPVVPGAVQIFTGTLLSRWTNGLLRPARHRVMPGGEVARRSAAIFFYPGLGQAFDPLTPFAEPASRSARKAPALTGVRSC